MSSRRPTSLLLVALLASCAYSFEYTHYLSESDGGDMLRYPPSPVTQIGGKDVAEMVSGMTTAASLSASLPTANLFVRPRASVLIFMEGEEALVQMPELSNTAHASTVRSVAGADINAVREMLTLHDGTPLATRMHEVSSNPLVFCASSDVSMCESVGSCPSVERLTSDDTLVKLCSVEIAEPAAIEFSLEGDFDMSSKSLATFAAEMRMLLRVPVTMGNAFAAQLADDTADVVVLAPTALKSVVAEFGADSAQVAAARAALDSTLNEVLRQVEAAQPGRVVTHLLVPASAGAASFHAGGRLLLQTGNNTGNGTLTSAQVNDYQIVLWTAVLLILLVLSVASALCGINFAQDNVLNTKFKTNYEGKRD